MPSPTQPTQTQNSIILERLENVRTDIAELKLSINALSRIYQEFVVQYTRAHTELAATTAQNKIDVANHEKRLELLENMVKPLALQGKIISYVGGAFVVIVLGFLWAIFTHQVNVIFP